MISSICHGWYSINSSSIGHYSVWGSEIGISMTPFIHHTCTHYTHKYTPCYLLASREIEENRAIHDVYLLGL